MRFATIFMATALAAVAESLRFTNANFYNITTGKPFNITWADASGPVALSLYKGATVALLEDMGTIAGQLSVLPVRSISCNSLLLMSISVFPRRPEQCQLCLDPQRYPAARHLQHPLQRLFGRQHQQLPV